jgi:type 1 glutamine amidotransferase
MGTVSFRATLVGAAVVLAIMLSKFIIAQDGDAPPKPKTSPVNVAADLVDKITKAAPAKATVKPAAKRKLLACTRSVGFHHDTIPVCAKMLEIMGNKTGAWETVITDDLNAFEPENLKEFDGVFFCVTTGPIFGDGPPDKVGVRFTRLRKSLADFVASGKGLGGNHGATDACYNWPEYGQMMGAYFTEHPFGKIVVKNDDPASPVNAAFKEKGFPIQDEMYVFGPKPQQNAVQNYSREKMHILLSIDVPESKLPNKGPRADQDYAISWIKPYEKGRVFYCSFGHDNNVYTLAPILQHFQDGVQYLLGDLKADDSPSVKTSDKPIEKPKDKPVEKPKDKPKDKPADKSKDKK